MNLTSERLLGTPSNRHFLPRMPINDRKYNVQAYTSDPRPLASNDAFKIEFGEVVCELWRRRIPRSGADVLDRLLLQKAFDEERRRAEHRRVNECLSAHGLRRAPGNEATKPRTSSPQRTRTTDPPNRVSAAVLSDVALWQQMAARGVCGTGIVERDRAILQRLFDEEHSRALLAHRRSPTPPQQSRAAAPADTLTSLAPQAAVARMQPAELRHELEVRRMGFTGKKGIDRPRLVAVLERELDCALEGWQDASLLSTRPLHAQMKRRGLLITGEQGVDAQTLQSALDIELSQRYHRHKTIIARALVPFGAGELTREELTVEMATRGLPQSRALDRDAKVLQRAMDEEYLVFLRDRIKHGLPVSVPMLPRKPSIGVTVASSLITAAKEPGPRSGDVPQSRGKVTPLAPRPPPSPPRLHAWPEESSLLLEAEL